MAGVATSSRAIFWGAVAFMLIGAAVTIFMAQPYLCDRKVDPVKQTVCHGHPTVAPARR